MEEHYFITVIGFSECQYNGRALIDLNLLKKYNEGIIVTTACIGSRFSKLVQQKKLEQAEQELLNFKDVFGDRFYLEIQPLSIPQQIITNAFYLEMHKKHNIPVIATSDTHYINKDDWDDHDTYLCISIRRLKDDEADKEIYRKQHKNDPECKKWKPRMKYTNDFWFRSKEEMIDGFIDQENNSSNIYRSLETDNPLQTEEYRNFWLEALNTTNKVADRIDDDILIGSATTLYPVAKNIPEGFTSDTWLFALAMEGLVKYADEMKKAGTPIDFKQYSDKIIDEMAVISTKHYSDYFLGVKEYAGWSNAINNETGFPNCITGPGRGCFLPNNFVVTNRGKIPIQDVQIGDKVKGHDENEHEVVNTLNYDCNEIITKIHCENNKTIKCTNDHKIFAIKKDDFDNGCRTPKWYKAECIEEGDLIATND